MASQAAAAPPGMPPRVGMLDRAATLLGRPVLQRTRTDLHFMVREATMLARTGSKAGIHAGVGRARAGDEESEESVEDSSGAEYDTDLEIEERKETPMDMCGRRTYVRTCRKLRLTPVGAVVQGLRAHTLTVVGRGLHQLDALAIAYAFQENHTVKSLSLDENRMGWEGTEYITLMLKENYTVESLSLASNSLGGTGCRSVVELMLENITITRLNISDNKLSDPEAYMIAILLQESHSLTYLNLSHNDIGDEGADVIGNTLGHNETLRCLDLSWNKIRPPGGAALCEGLHDNIVLSTLNLAYNGLSTSGAGAIAEALTVNETLTDLDLTCNRIFDAGTLKIGKALTTNETLRTLRIANNPMTTATAMGMLAVLKTNEYNALELLDMSSVHIYKNTLDLIDEIREIRPTFNFLYGGVVNSDDAFGEGDNAFDNRNPLTILKEYIASKNMRLVDLFKQFDKDGGGSISREEFIQGLKSIEVPLTRDQLDRLINMLDKDGDGEVDYGELVSGDREHRRKQFKIKMAAVEEMKRARRKKRQMQAAIAAEGKPTGQQALQSLGQGKR